MKVDLCGFWAAVSETSKAGKKSARDLRLGGADGCGKRLEMAVVESYLRGGVADHSSSEEGGN